MFLRKIPSGKVPPFLSGSSPDPAGGRVLRLGKSAEGRVPKDLRATDPGGDLRGALSEPETLGVPETMSWGYGDLMIGM